MEGFAKAANRSDVTGGELKLVEIEGEEIVLADVGGDVVAFSNVCPHAGCDLVDGEMDDDQIECVCHGSRFDVKTGEVINGPATENLPLYTVHVEGDDVMVGPA